MDDSSDLSVIIKCGVCLETLTRPMMLPCQHHYCKVCIDRWIEEKSDDEQISCPICKSMCQLDAINYGFFMQQIIEYNTMKEISQPDEPNYNVQHIKKPSNIFAKAVKMHFVRIAEWTNTRNTQL
jgi:hypothetical protein